MTPALRPARLATSADIVPAPRGERLLTTGAVARICRVSPQTVIKWIDKGMLPGFKIPTTSGHRRVAFCALLDFAHEHRMTHVIDAMELPAK